MAREDLHHCSNYSDQTRDQRQHSVYCSDLQRLDHQAEDGDVLDLEFPFGGGWWKILGKTLRAFLLLANVSKDLSGLASPTVVSKLLDLAHHDIENISRVKLQIPQCFPFDKAPDERRRLSPFDLVENGELASRLRDVGNDELGDE